MAEVAGAVGNIAVQGASGDSKYKAAIDAYNGAMGIIGLKNWGVGGYKFVTKLPGEAKDLLQKNTLRSKLLSYYLDWKVAVTQLDKAGAESELITKQEKV
jgi:hypothetical protein